MNFAAVVKGKTFSMYSSKEKSGFAVRKKVDFVALLRKTQPYL